LKEKLLNRMISRKPSAMRFSLDTLINLGLEGFRLMGGMPDSKEIAARLLTSDHWP